AWIGVVRVSERSHLAVAAIAHGVWRVVRREFPLVAGNAAKEDAAGAVDDRLAIVKGIPGEAKTRREMVIRGEYTALGDTRISREQHADRGQCLGGADDRHGRKCMRLHAGLEVRLHALGIGGRLLPVVANTDVNGKVAEEFPVILREDSVAEIVRVCIQASILAHAGWSSSEEVR